MKKHRLEISLLVMGMEMNHDTLETKSLGGSETAGICMAQELAALGHEVSLFCNTTKEGVHDGVHWIHQDKLQGYLEYCSTDVTINQRIPELYQKENKSKINILWNHDVAVKNRRSAFSGALWNIDEVWGLSDYHINQQAEIYQCDKSLFWKTRNGITQLDDEMSKVSIPRNKKRLVFTNRPERGLDNLLYNIAPKLWERDKEIEIVIAGYDNTHPDMAQYYAELNNQINLYKQQGFQIGHVGSLTKKDLYGLYMGAGVYVYPTNFKETSCITVMEAQMCGLPMVTSNIGALPETCKQDYASIIDGDAKSDQYHKAFIDSVFELIENETAWKKASTAGLSYVENNQWKHVAKEWQTHLYEMFEKRTANKETLSKHLYKNENIIALRKLAEDNDLKEWKEKVDTEYPYLDSVDKYNEFYVQLGKELKEEMDAMNKEFPLQEYSRTKIVLQEIGHYINSLENRKEQLSILDYGAGIGNESVLFTGYFGAKVHSVNISDAEIEMTKKFIDKNCKKPELIDIIKESSPANLKIPKVDIAYCGEVLEHQPNPKQFIDDLESQVKNNGYIIFTVPFGLWEDERKAHLWNFEREQLREMLKNKKDFNMKMCSAGRNTNVEDNLGWWIFSWKKTVAKTGELNIQRMIDLQSPTQTVSVCMILKDGEDMIRRCLKSVKPFADEIIVVDNGSTDNGVEICKQFGAKIITSENATEIGFDACRNKSIKDAKGDWIFWIDDDEEVTNVANIFKYLRPNIFNGYSIKQHHFTTDPVGAFKVDLPIRLFRNNLGIKFFGYVHEHPEFKINDGVGASSILSDVDIAHDGYFTEVGRKGRFQRNINLMLKDRKINPERNLGKFLMIRDWVHLARYEMEQRGQMTPQAKEYLEKAVKEFRDEFLNCVEGDPKIFYLEEGLGFYSEALHTLGLGLEYRTFIDIALESTKSQGKEVVARFETNDDYLKWLKIVTRSKSEPFIGEFA